MVFRGDGARGGTCDTTLSARRSRGREGTLVPRFAAAFAFGVSSLQQFSYFIKTHGLRSIGSMGGSLLVKSEGVQQEKVKQTQSISSYNMHTRMP